MVAMEVRVVDAPVMECLLDAPMTICVLSGSDEDLLLDVGQGDWIRKDLSLCADRCLQGVCKSHEFALAGYVVILISA